MRSRLLIMLTVVLAASVIMPSSAKAIVSQGIGLAPVTNMPNPTTQQKAYFYYKLPPGAVQHSSFTLSNYTQNTRTIQLSAVDATTTADGTFAMLNTNGSLTGSGAWINLSVTKTTLPPRTKQTIPFTFTVPAHASVGDHLGGIVATDSNQTEQKLNVAQANVKVVTRIGLRIYASVLGKASQKVDIADFSTNRKNSVVTFWASLHNSGNTITSPTGWIDVKEWGRPIAKMDTAKGVILAPDAWYKHSSAKDFHPKLVGYYTATLQLKQAAGTTSKNTSFLIINWRNVIIGIFIIALIAIKYVTRKPKRMVFRR